MQQLENDAELQTAYAAAVEAEAEAAATAPAPGAAPAAHRPAGSLKDSLQELLTGLKQEREAVAAQGSSLVAACTAVARPVGKGSPPPQTQG